MIDKDSRLSSMISMILDYPRWLQWLNAVALCSKIAKIAKYNDAEAGRAILRLLLDGGRKKCEADKIGIQPIFKHKEERIPLYFTSTSCVREI